MDEFANFRRQAIESLISQPLIRWFVDANVLQSGFVERNFASFDRVATISEVAVELRRRPEEAKSGLRVLKTIEANGQIASGSWFGDHSESLSLLAACAVNLAPTVRLRTLYLMEKESLGQEKAEQKALDQLAAEGDFFASRFRREAAGADFAAEYIDRVNEATRRSWFRHPAKRRKKVGQGDYLQTDERLVGFAIANAILRGEATCIASNDTDLAAVMKQFADNLLWAMSVIDCEARSGKVVVREVADLWESRCKELDKLRYMRGMQSIFDVVSRGKDVSLDPSIDEVLICRPDDGHISRFLFSEQMISFAKNFKLISARHSLAMNGFWLPPSSS